jgi:hypothetical protein
MAENRGGNRPTAPQNNPMNVSATGGAGQSGTQAAQYIPGMRSQGVTSKEVYEQQTAPGASMAGPTRAPSAAAPMSGPMFGGAMDLLGETQFPEEPISAGTDFGDGPGMESLPPEFNSNAREMENIEIVKRYLPSLMQAAKLPDAPDTYKAFLNYLIKQVYK